MTPESAALELNRQAEEQGRMAARREREGTAEECLCGEYDCEYYDCQDYDQEGNLKDAGELESFIREFHLGAKEGKNATMSGIDNAFACDPEDPTCIPDGVEG